MAKFTIFIEDTPKGVAFMHDIEGDDDPPTNAINLGNLAFKVMIEAAKRAGGKTIFEGYVPAGPPNN